MTNQNTSNHSNKPIDHVRLGAIRAAIWQNTDSQGRIRYGTTFERAYVDQKGDWQSTTSFGRDDLLTLAKVADMANTRIHEIQAEDREHADRSADTRPLAPSPASGGVPTAPDTYRSSPARRAGP